MNQYKITVNNTEGSITEFFPGEQWEKIAQVYEERGLTAKLERRLIITGDTKEFLETLTNPKGFLKLKNKVICPWEVIAELI